MSPEERIYSEDLTQDLGDASGPSYDPSPICQKMVYLEGWLYRSKQGEYIIDAVWDLHRERNKRQPTSKEERWDVLQEAWRTIPEDCLKK